MHNDLLPSDPAPLPAPIAPPRPSRFVCDFCKSSLAPSGDVLKMSDEAKAYRDASDTIDTLRGRIAELEGSIGTLTRERDAALAAIPKPSRGIFSS